MTSDLHRLLAAPKSAESARWNYARDQHAVHSPGRAVYGVGAAPSATGRNRREGIGKPEDD